MPEVDRNDGSYWIAGRDGNYVVMWSHPDWPDWHRQIALFASRERAAEYIMQEALRDADPHYDTREPAPDLQFKDAAAPALPHLMHMPKQERVVRHIERRNRVLAALRAYAEEGSNCAVLSQSMLADLTGNISASHARYELECLVKANLVAVTNSPRAKIGDVNRVSSFCWSVEVMAMAALEPIIAEIRRDKADLIAAFKRRRAVGQSDVYLPQSQMQVLDYLAAHADAKGETYVSQVALADAVGLTPSNANVAIRRCREAGLLQVRSKATSLQPGTYALTAAGVAQVVGGAAAPQDGDHFLPKEANARMQAVMQACVGAPLTSGADKARVADVVRIMDSHGRMRRTVPELSGERILAVLPELYAANPSGLTIEQLMAKLTDLSAHEVGEGCRWLAKNRKARWAHTGFPNPARKYLFPWNAKQPEYMLSHAQNSVLQALRERANGEPSVTITLAELSRVSGVPKGTINYAIDGLRYKGYITRTATQCQGGSAPMLATYALREPKPQSDEAQA